MARFRKWTVKNTEQNKKYKTSLGITDYDIPMFGYKSITLIFVSIILSMFLIPAFCSLIQIDFIIVGSLIAGFTISYSQYFINSKIGITKSFWLVGLIWSILIGIIYYFIVMTGVIL